MVPAVGDPDLSHPHRRGLVIFPAEPGTPPRGEWWLVLAAVVLAGATIAVAFAIR